MPRQKKQTQSYAEYRVEKIKKFIETHRDDINNGNFEKIYHIDASVNSDLTQLFNKQGIDPAKYMDSIPKGYLPYLYRQTYIIPDNIKIIEDEAFNSDLFEHIKLSKNIITIGNRAFSNNNNLKDIILPNSVKTIGKECFDYCGNLVTCFLGTSIDTLPDNLFRFCYELKNVSVPFGVRSLGYGVFKGCESLERIKLPNSIVNIGDFIFEDCKSLKIVQYMGTKAEWDRIHASTNSFKYVGNSFSVQCFDEIINFPTE